MIYYCCFAYGFVFAQFLSFIVDKPALDKKTLLIAILALLLAPVIIPVVIFAYFLFSSKEDL